MFSDRAILRARPEPSYLSTAHVLAVIISIIPSATRSNLNMKEDVSFLPNDYWFLRLSNESIRTCVENLTPAKRMIFEINSIVIRTKRENVKKK